MAAVDASATPTPVAAAIEPLVRADALALTFRRLPIIPPLRPCCYATSWRGTTSWIMARK